MEALAPSPESGRALKLPDRAADTPREVSVADPAETPEHRTEEMVAAIAAKGDFPAAARRLIAQSARQNSFFVRHQ